MQNSSKKPRYIFLGKCGYNNMYMILLYKHRSEVNWCVHVYKVPSGIQTINWFVYIDNLCLHDMLIIKSLCKAWISHCHICCICCHFLSWWILWSDSSTFCGGLFCAKLPFAFWWLFLFYITLLYVYLVHVYNIYILV